MILPVNSAFPAETVIINNQGSTRANPPTLVYVCKTSLVMDNGKWVRDKRILNRTVILDDRRMWKLYIPIYYIICTTAINPLTTNPFSSSFHHFRQQKDVESVYSYYYIICTPAINQFTLFHCQPFHHNPGLKV